MTKTRSLIKPITISQNSHLQPTSFTKKNSILASLSQFLKHPLPQKKKKNTSSMNKKLKISKKKENLDEWQ
jgi:hypothetical protein